MPPVSTMRHSKVLLPFALAVVAVPLIAVLAGGCKKDEPPPPLPVASETAVPPPTPVSLTPDLPDAPDDGDADAKPVGVGKPFDSSRIRACCAALRQNAASAPPPNNAYMLAAAGYCDAVSSSLNKPGQTDAVLAMVRGALKGAPAPAACR